MKISKQEFQNIFDEVRNKIKNENPYEELLKLYSDENGKISSHQFALFTYFESINFSEQLIYSLFEKLFIEE